MGKEGPNSRQRTSPEPTSKTMEQPVLLQTSATTPAILLTCSQSIEDILIGKVGFLYYKLFSVTVGYQLLRHKFSLAGLKT